ncbi:MAG: HEPN domain-containing protein [Oscillospiraceae bacterium]|nr:HEPN domain-containing protein [Oscillospiraceae bacterium]
MKAQEKYEYWLAYAKEDIKTAEAMISTRRWIYVAFMCQQAVEKLIKGLYGLYFGFDSIPHTHNITRLANDLSDKLSLKIDSETFDFFDLLTRYYLNNRYPDYINDLYAQTQEGNSKEIYAKTREVFSWLLTLSR